MENNVINETVEEVVETGVEALGKIDVNPKYLAAGGVAGAGLLALGYVAGKFHVLGKIGNGVKSLVSKVFRKKNNAEADVIDAEVSVKESED